MTCEKCNSNQIMDNIWKERTKTKFLDNFCSKCYVELVLAEGNCDRCDSIVRHRINEQDNLVPLQVMALLRGKFVHRIMCSCGGQIKLLKIANKDFMTRLSQVC